jgi:hypothetical protein
MIPTTTDATFGDTPKGEKPFTVRAGLPLGEAIEQAACLLCSAGQELADLMAETAENHLVSARLHLVRHAVVTAEALAWAACEAKGLDGGAS